MLAENIVPWKLLSCDQKFHVCRELLKIDVAIGNQKKTI